ncbi:MAG: hypothetical protein AAF533_14205 [Acidobacteriota bacterium]
MRQLTQRLLPALLATALASAASAQAPHRYQIDGALNACIFLGGETELHFANRFDVVPQAERITAVELFLFSGCGSPTGIPAEFTVYEDPNDDGVPDDLVTVAHVRTTLDSLNAVQVVPMPEDVIVEGSFFIGLHVTITAGMGFIADPSPDAGEGTYLRTGLPFDEDVPPVFPATGFVLPFRAIGERGVVEDCANLVDDDDDSLADCDDDECLTQHPCLPPELLCEDGRDDDGDGLFDCDDPDCYRLVTCDQADSDRDGVPNAADNCLAVSNPRQLDIDGNGIGDACEAAYAFDIVSTGEMELDSFVFFVDEVAPLTFLGAMAGDDVADFDCLSAPFASVIPALQCDTTSGADPATGTTLRFARFAFEHEGSVPPCEALVFGLDDPTEFLDAELVDIAPDAIDCESPCLSGDLFPDGEGDGLVTLADYALGLRKVLGIVPTNERDLECADLAPGELLCSPTSGPDHYCVAGDGALGIGDAIAIRRLLLRSHQLRCDDCIELLSTDLPQRPGDAMPADGRDGVVDITDVVHALRLSVGLEEGTSEELEQLDIAPIGSQDGVDVAWGDGRVTVADVVEVLRVSVGLRDVQWPKRELSVRLEESDGPAIGFAFLVEGWPAWAEAIDWEAGPCERDGEAAGQLGDTDWGVTCITDPTSFGADIELVRLTYRARAEVSADDLSWQLDLLDAHLGELAGTVALVSP